MLYLYILWDNGHVMWKWVDNMSFHKLKKYQEPRPVIYVVRVCTEIAGLVPLQRHLPGSQVGSCPDRDTCGRQPVDVPLSHRCFSLSRPSTLSQNNGKNVIGWGLTTTTTTKYIRILSISEPGLLSFLHLISMPRQIATAQPEGQGKEDVERGSADEFKEKRGCWIMLTWLFK